MAVDLIWIAGLTLLIEAVTCAFRWGLDLQSTRDTSFLAPLTFGVRIHHGYVGAASALGAMRGQFTMADGWERALTDEEAEAFWGGR